VTVVPPVHAFGVAAHKAAQPASAGLVAHWAMITAMPPVQIGSVGLEVQIDTIRAAQPVRDGLAEHCAMVTAVPPVQAPGVAAHRAAQPASDGLAEHWAIVTAAPVPPEQIGLVGLVVQVTMMSTQVEVAGFHTRGATQLPTV